MNERSLNAGALLCRPLGFHEREQRYAAGALCAEVDHSLSATLLLLRDLAAHAPLDEGDHESLCEEISRLASVLLSLRSAQTHLQPPQPLLFRPVFDHALERARSMGGEVFHIEPSTTADLTVSATGWALEFLLTALLTHAARSSHGTEVTVRSQVSAEAVDLFILSVGVGPVGHGLQSLGAESEGLTELAARNLARSQGWSLRETVDGRLISVHLTIARWKEAES